MTYDYTSGHIIELLAVISLRRMSVPEGFTDSSIEYLLACYNGIGPDRWSARFRRAMTRLLEFLESPALIHDWEYSQADKSYWHFTRANARICWNAWKDGRFRTGLAAAILCQLFGYSGYKHGGAK